MMNKSVKPHRWAYSAALLVILAGGVIAAVLYVTSQPRAHNVLLVTIDTLRADHLPLYGYENGKTPNLDRLAGDGVLFKTAVSHAPLTLVSHSSILTGTYPFFHGVRNNGSYHAPDALNTAAEIFGAHGYDTAAFVGSFVLDSRFGLDQGFDVYDDDMIDGRQKHSLFEFKDRIAENVISRVLAWFEKRPKDDQAAPFFLWVHLFDPHKEYEPPEPYRSEFAANLYDGEIAYTDSQLGRLFDRLKADGLYDDTLIAVTSDHGESMGEHGELTHSIFIYNATTWVPLIIKAPGNEFAGTVVAQLAQHIDMLPTLLDISKIGGAADEALIEDIQGSSLLPAMEGDPDGGEVYAYAESYLPKFYYKWSPPVSIRSGNYKYIHLPTPELYDMRADPDELINIFEGRKELGAEYARRLDELVTTLSEGKPADARQEMDAETLAKLKSLGYIHGGEDLTGGDEPADEGPDTGQDPKDMIFVHQEIMNIHNLINQKNHEQAIARAESLLSDYPENLQARSALAGALVKTGKVDAAIRELNVIKQYDPTFLTAYTGLARIYTKKKVDFALAQKELEAAFAIVPWDPSLWVVKGDLEQERGEVDKSLVSYQKAAAMGDQSASLYVGLGSAHNKLNRLSEAQQLLEKAIVIQNDYAEAHYNLGVVYAHQGKKELALAKYRRAIELDDTNPFFFTNLGSLLTDRKEYPQAIEALKSALRIEPRHPEAIYNLGTVYLLTDRAAEAIPLLEQVIQIKPHLIVAYNNLALGHTKLRQLDKALQVYAAMTRIAPNLPMPWYRMAQIAIAAKQPQQAREHLGRAIGLGGEQFKAMARQDPNLTNLHLEP